MIVGTLRILPAPHRRAEVLEIFQGIQGPVVEQPGCLACHVYEEPLPGQAIVLVERWQSQTALEAHLSSEIYRQILGAIELSGGPPEVCFDYVSATEGMDLIERSRTPGRTADEKEHESAPAGREGRDPESQTLIGGNTQLVKK